MADDQWTSLASQSAMLVGKILNERASLSSPGRRANRVATGHGREDRKDRAEDERKPVNAASRS